jgi:Ca2+-binding RTX toxin-like protein
MPNRPAAGRCPSPDPTSAGNAVPFHVKVVPVGVVNGNLYVYGTPGNDVILAKYLDGTFTVQFPGHAIPQFTAGTGQGQVNPTTGRVIINGLDGNDLISMSGAFPAEIHCGAGNDTVHGGAGGDVIYAEAPATACWRLP